MPPGKRTRTIVINATSLIPKRNKQFHSRKTSAQQLRQRDVPFLLGHLGRRAHRGLLGLVGSGGEQDFRDSFVALIRRIGSLPHSAAMQSGAAPLNVFGWSTLAPAASKILTTGSCPYPAAT